MFDYLERVKQLPKHQRKAFALVSALSITGVIVVVWLTVLILGDGLGNYRFEVNLPPVPGKGDGDPGWQNLHNAAGQDEPQSWDSYVAQQESTRTRGTASSVPSTTDSGTTTNQNALENSTTTYTSSLEEQHALAAQEQAEQDATTTDPFSPKRLGEEAL